MMETVLGLALAAQFNSDAIEQIISACDDAHNQLQTTARECNAEIGLKAALPLMHDAETFAQISAVLRQLRV